MNKFKHWINNVNIKTKFIPLQFFVILSIFLISTFSFVSVALVNNSSEKIIDENVRNKEQLSEIIRDMYVCRVLGRDILFATDEDVKNAYYVDYITAFDTLDSEMDDFATHLSGSQLSEFLRIIEEKNVYKDSMILSADIWISGGAYEDALYALQVVTPIANEFFGSIDDFSAEEERIMLEALDRNDNLVLSIFIAGVFFCIAISLGTILFTHFFSSSMSSSLISLENSMSKIAETGNMKIEIPANLYTKDEVGKIAGVANKMKTMLLEYSFKDTLTGGYNAKAYHEELNDIFEHSINEKELWCVIADMNNLKLINDHLGHMEGDNAIRNSYYSLNVYFEPYGKTFRVGGDEFVSLLIGCSKEDLENCISNITSDISKINLNNSKKFSLAFGYDIFKGNTIEDFNEFFKSVDKKMYDNKIAFKQSRIDARVHPNGLFDEDPK